MYKAKSFIHVLFLVFMPAFPLFLFSCPNTGNVCDQGDSLTTGLGIEYYWTYDSFPITVSIDKNLSPNKINSTIIAINYWNAEIGREVFVHEMVNFDEQKDYQISVSMKELGKSNSGVMILGLAAPRVVIATGRMISVDVYFDNDLIDIGDITDFESVSVMTHELGHALTLAHDPCNKDSIMYNYALTSHLKLEAADKEIILRMMGGPE